MNNLIYNPLGQIAGYVNFDTYYTQKDSTKHLFKKFQGYGISETILSQLKDKGVRTIQILEVDTNKTYRIAVENFEKSKKSYTFEGDVQKFVSVYELPTKKSKKLTDWWEGGRWTLTNIQTFLKKYYLNPN